MILEAFAEALKARFQSGQSPVHILQDWLLHYLEAPLVSRAEDMVQHVIHAEIELSTKEPFLVFQGRSPSGDMLLKSLYEYCLSYEDWQYRRWLHEVKASDFEHDLTS